MTTELAPSSPEWDFSKYRPGDVVIFSEYALNCAGHDVQSAAAHLERLARRAGLRCMIFRDVLENAIRIEFRGQR